MEKLISNDIKRLPSTEQAWMKYYPEDFKNGSITIPNKTIYELLEEAAKEFKSKTVLEYFNVKIKYDKYIRLINEYFLALNHMNVKPNEIILLIMPNVPEHRELIYSINILGGIPYPITPMTSTKALSEIIEKNGVRNVFIFDGFYDKYKNVLTSNSIENIVITTGKESLPKLLVNMLELKEKRNGTAKVITDKKCLPFMEFKTFNKYVHDFQRAEYSPNKTAVIIGTSGTTGVSKGVCLTNENINAMAIQHRFGDMNFKPGDKLLDILLPSIGYGISVAHYSAICGIKSILIPNLVFDMQPVLGKYKPDHFTGGPVHYASINNALQNGKRIHVGKNYVSGGAPLPKSDEKSLNSVEVDKDGNYEYDDENVIVRQGYGTTECCGGATYSKKGAYKYGSVGIPLPLVTLGVFVPDTDEELSYNVEGEICITGPTVMLEYLNNIDETKKVLKVHSDGKTWLHTKDLGYVDEDGSFYITDRIKNMFARIGFNVHPGKIADSIAMMDIVEECYVIGYDHPTQQKVPVAFIKLKSNENLEEKKEFIKQYCVESLEETSVPYEYVFVDEFPRNIGGKVMEDELKAKANIDYIISNDEKKLTIGSGK